MKVHYIMLLMTIISFASGSLIVGKSEKARVFLKDKVGLYSNEEA